MKRSNFKNLSLFASEPDVNCTAGGGAGSSPTQPAEPGASSANVRSNTGLGGQSDEHRRSTIRSHSWHNRDISQVTLKTYSGTCALDFCEKVLDSVKSWHFENSISLPFNFWVSISENKHCTGDLSATFFNLLKSQ